jgi:hypothetical protein
VRDCYRLDILILFWHNITQRTMLAFGRLTAKTL